MNSNSSGEQRSRRWIRGACDIVVIAIALSGVCVLASGCGRDSLHSSYTPSASKQVGSQSSGTPAPSSSGEASQAVTAVPASSEVPATGSGGETPAMPPEIAVSIADTLVERGATVEIRAEATSDVTEMVLWDGLNDRQAFYRDATTKEWRVSYRVPLRPQQQRIGLSVTARNEAGRWRRVWLFLQVGSPVTEVPTRPDPVEGEGS